MLLNTSHGTRRHQLIRRVNRSVDVNVMQSHLLILEPRKVPTLIFLEAAKMKMSAMWLHIVHSLAKETQKNREIKLAPLR